MISTKHRLSGSQRNLIKPQKAVVLLSGGIDSSVTSAFAKAEGYELYALSFDYNQRHRIELESAKNVASALGVKKHLIIKFDLREIGGSALLDDTKMRRQKEAEKKPFTVTSIPVTYVPARNTIFLSFALAWAEVMETGDIFIGANAVDYSGYPDCRPEYLKAFEHMANLAVKASIEGKLKFRINAPLIRMTKAEIIKKGVELGLDYSLTWSCYDPQKDRNALSVIRNKLKQNTHNASRITHHGFIPCGRCDSCLFRAKGFKEAKIKDPILTTK